MLELWPADEPAIVVTGGLVLREWTDDDVPAMVGLFDTAEMDRWTPLASPFDAAAATVYVHRAHDRRRASGFLQLAITEDGVAPLGEVLVMPVDAAGTTVELGYAVGAGHTCRGLARRAVGAVLPLATAAGASRALLRIVPGNIASERVAAATGFALTDEPMVVQERKNRTYRFATWTRALSG